MKVFEIYFYNYDEIRSFIHRKIESGWQYISLKVWHFVPDTPNQKFVAIKMKKPAPIPGGGKEKLEV